MLEEKVADSDLEDEILLRRGTYGFALIVFLTIIALGLYFWNFAKLGWDARQETWGQFGDFIGGLLNPAIGLVTVYLVLVNVRLQRKELRNSLMELRNSNETLIKQTKNSEYQNFQQTFFTWLNSYQDLVSAVTYNYHDPQVDAAITRTGRDALNFLWVEQFSDMNTRITNSLAKQKRESFPISFLRSDILSAWENVHGATAYQTSSMFRTLYRLIQWVDEQPEKLISIDAKNQFLSIVRAQLSDVELVYIFFNGFTKRGHDFNKLINKYALLDNLDFNRSLTFSYLCQEKGNPFEESAFDSAVATKGL